MQMMRAYVINFPIAFIHLASRVRAQSDHFEVAIIIADRKWQK